MFIHQDVSHIYWALWALCAIFFCIVCALVYVICICCKIKKYFQRDTEHGDNPVNEPKAARASDEMREDAEGFVHRETEDLPRITIVIKQDEWLSDSIQRLVGGSVSVYECHCQSEPMFCLEIKWQDVSKFIKALKQVSKPHTAEKEDPQVSQHQEATSTGRISIDQEELNALHYFDKDFITSNFTEEREAQEAITASEGVFLRPKTAEYAQKLESLRNSLRKEDIALSSNEFETFIQSFDGSSTDLGVFMVPNHEECKVTVYAMNYDAMTKAKHVVCVKSGKIKTTSRDLRKFNTKFDSIALTSDIGDSQQNSVSDVTRNHTKGRRLPSEKIRFAGEIDNKGDESHQPLPSIPVDYVTDSGIQVSVYKADITQLTVDAIVNAANGHLQHGGGVAAVIARAAGTDLELEGYQYVKQHGPLSVTQVVPTTAGNLPCKKVFHAVGPRWYDYQDKDKCLLHLEQTVFNSLKTAHDLKFSSTAVSSISSAIFGVPKDLCARMYLAAVQRFDKHLGSSSSLRRVHFVDVNDEMVGLIQKTFTDNWSFVITPPSTQQFDLENETSVHSLKSTSSNMQSQTSNCNSSEQEIIQNGDELSKQRENKEKNSSCPPVENSSCPPVENSSCPPIENSSCPPIENSSCPPIENSSCPPVKHPSSPPPNKPQNLYQFRLQNLDLNFSQHTVEESNAEALVFWQGPEEFSTEHLQNAKIPPRGIKKLKQKLKKNKFAVTTLPTKIVIVISFPSITREKVREIIGEVLDVVHQNKKVTISILVSYDKASSKDLQEMSTGLYLAVQKYSETEEQIKEIHVLNSNADSLKIMADILQTFDSKSFT